MNKALGFCGRDVFPSCLLRLWGEDSKHDDCNVVYILPDRTAGGETVRRFKCYGVSKGRGVGIFGTWQECWEMVKDFPGARFRGFYSRADAESWLAYEGMRERAGQRRHDDR